MRRLMFFLCVSCFVSNVYSQNFKSDFKKAIAFYDLNSSFTLKMNTIKYVSENCPENDTSTIIITKNNDFYVLEMGYVLYLQKANSYVGIYHDSKSISYASSGSVLNNAFKKLSDSAIDSLITYFSDIYFSDSIPGKKKYSATFDDSFYTSFDYTFDSITGLMSKYEMLFPNNTNLPYSKIILEYTLLPTKNIQSKEYEIKNYLKIENKKVHLTTEYSSYHLQLIN